MIYSPKFFKCVECNTLVEALNPQCCDDLVCCGRPMRMLRVNNQNIEAERHIPVVKRENGCITVCVGRILHPMCHEHSILWVELRSKNTCRRVYLKKGDDPIIIFRDIDETIQYRVYSYCNIHGLWRSDAQ